MKVIYTYHAKNKFANEKYVFDLKITKTLVQKTILNPDYENRTRGEKVTALVQIDPAHLLLVVYKRISGGIIKVITFYPIRSGGKYESKILQER